jgi:hypothetical protein
MWWWKSDKREKCPLNKCKDEYNLSKRGTKVAERRAGRLSSPLV